MTLVPEYRGTGVPRYRSTGVPECRDLIFPILNTDTAALPYLLNPFLTVDSCIQSHFQGKREYLGSKSIKMIAFTANIDGIAQLVSKPKESKVQVFIGDYS